MRAVVGELLHANAGRRARIARAPRAACRSPEKPGSIPFVNSVVPPSRQAAASTPVSFGLALAGWIRFIIEVETTFLPERSRAAISATASRTRVSPIAV